MSLRLLRTNSGRVGTADHKEAVLKAANRILKSDFKMYIEYMIPPSYKKDTTVIGDVVKVRGGGTGFRIKMPHGKPTLAYLSAIGPEGKAQEIVRISEDPQETAMNIVDALESMSTRVYRNPSGIGRQLERPYYGARPKPTRRAALEEGLGETPQTYELPFSETLKQQKKVVVGGQMDFKGAELNREGALAFASMTGGEEYDAFTTPRHHPALVWLAENRKHFFTSPKIRVLAVPGGKYEIREYDGAESLFTPETIKWTVI